MVRYNLGEVLASIALLSPDQKLELLQFMSRDHVKTQEGKYLSGKEYINSLDEGQEKKDDKGDKRPGPTKPSGEPTEEELDAVMKLMKI